MTELLVPTKLVAFADYKCTSKGEFCLWLSRKQNGGKEDNFGYMHFFNFSTLFSYAFSFRVFKTRDYGGKELN